MESHDLDRIRFVTRHYGDLQGLRFLIPMGLARLVLGLCAMLPIPGLALVATMIGLMPVVVGGMIALMFYSSSYYRKRFGKVHPTRAQWLPLTALFAVLILLPLGYVWYRGARFGDRPDYIFYGSLLLFSWLVKECHISQLYDLVLGALLVGIALPVHSPSGFLLPELGSQATNQLLTGGAWVLAGLLDHWQLVRTLGPRHLEDLEEEAA